MKGIQLPDKWLVIGCGSLVGSRFVELTAGVSDVYGAGGRLDTGTPNIKGFNELDVTDTAQVLRVVSNFPGKYVINFAGVTLVDQAEKDRPTDPKAQVALDRNMAWRVNVLGTRNIAESCRQTGKTPIFISTGFVFDGANGPYTELSPIATSAQQVCWYAWTKICAEQEARRSGVSHINLRISYPYRREYSAKTDFARSLLQLYDDVQNGIKAEFYPIFADQKLTPTFIDDLPEAVLAIIESGERGTFHLTSPEITSPYEFCLELLRVAKGVKEPERIVPVGSLVDFQKAHPELAKRPLKGGELPEKISKLGFIPTGWKEGIKKAFG